MVANVETMFSVRQVPWHGIGTVVQDAPTSADAIRLAGLDWTVEQLPVYCDGMEAENRRGNVRRIVNPETGEIEKTLLGIVSDSYRPVQNSEAFDFFDSLIGTEARYETAGSINEGRRVFLTAKMEKRWQVADDDIDTYLLLSNGHDGFHALRAAITPIRVVCQNTLNLALRKAQRAWGMGHYSNIHDKMREAKHALGLTAAYMDEFVEFGNRAADQRVSEGVMSALVDELFKPKGNVKVSQKTVEKNVSAFESCLRQSDIRPYANTVWGVLNAVSDYETHRTRKQVTAMKKVMNDRLELLNRAQVFLAQTN